MKIFLMRDLDLFEKEKENDASTHKTKACYLEG